LVGSGFGPTLADAVAGATHQASNKVDGGAHDVDGLRVQLDRPSKWEPVKLEDGLTEPVGELGTHGFIAADGDGHVGYLLPMEILRRTYYFTPKSDDDFARIDVKRVREALASRAGVGTSNIDEMITYRFSLISEVESSPSGKSVPLFRGAPLHPESVDAPALVAAVRAAADYLVRGMNDQGDFSYLVHPTTGILDHGYSALRHAGTIYALSDAYTETHAQEHLAGAQAAIKALLPRLTQTPEGAFLADREDEEQLKVGGAGLALIALVRYTEASGDRAHLDTMRSLAKLIVHQQYPDGHFRSNVDVRTEEDAGDNKKLRKEIWYFPGEAMLGLVRLYGLDPDRKWLDAATKAADFTIANESPKIANHWLSYALLDLYKATHKEAYADHAFAIANNIKDGMISPGTADAPDQVGAMDARGETTPVSTRLEALAAIFELARVMGKDEGWIQRLAVQEAAFTIGQQIDRQGAFFAKHPDKVVGGVRESLLVSDIRIDYDQHAMCAWLRLARLLRDTNFGKESSPPPSNTHPLPPQNTSKNK
jgi:hypothetical protein